jgi:hypothetical protein
MAASLNRMVGYLLLVVATALLMLWPAYINKGPFWFPDTSSYVRGADAAAVFLTGKPSEWSDRLTIPKAPAAAAKGADPDASGTAPPSAAPPVASTRPVLLGRSIYYGILIYVPMTVAGPWAAVFLQALLASGLLVLCASIVLADTSHRFSKIALLVAATAALTPFSFYVAMLMPDIFAGLLILVLATLFGCWHRLAAWQAAVLVGAACVMVTFHTTILLLALVVGLGGIVALRGARARLLGACALLAIVAAGAGSSIAFSLAIERALHQPPISPPFLSARTTATGPGLAYLHKTCARDPARWELCAHLPNLPQTADVFLWSFSPSQGVFQIADARGQRQMARQDKALFVKVMLDDPLGVAAISVRSTFEQLGGFDYENFNYNDLHISLIPDKYPPAIGAAIADTLAARKQMPTALAERVAVASTLLAVLLIALSLTQRFVAPDQSRERYTRVALLILLGVLANAAICGVLSGPHARYQMRLIWLLPLAAMLRPAISRRSAAPLARQDAQEHRP